MKTFKMSKNWTFMLCILLCITLIGVSVMIAIQKNTDIFDKVAIEREIVLNKENVDVQSMLDSFDNVITVQDEEMLVFEGTKKFDTSLLEEIDNLSETQVEELSDVSVRYHFTYNRDSNIVTLSAEMKMPNGEVSVDTIEGVGFINENNEIDAVMNVEGEGILLSEMQNAGMIENCGWFSKLIKKVAKVVVAAAVAVAAVAVVVATAGAAAPAVVAAGIGVTTTVVTTAAATAATIGMVSLSVAAIAAGVAITASVLEFTFENVKYKLEAITDALRLSLQNGMYVLAAATTDGKLLASPIMINRDVAARAMRAGLSVYTYYQGNAYDVAKNASNGLVPVSDEAHQSGYFRHYHRNARKGAAHAFYGMPIFSF